MAELPRIQTGPSGGQRLGSSVADLLSTGLQHVAERRIDALKRNELSKHIESLGYSPQQASAYAHMSYGQPQVLRELIKQQGQRGEQKQQQSQKANEPFLKDAQKAYEVGDKLESIVSEMKQLAQDSNFQGGAISGKRPEFLMNDVTRRYYALSQEVPALLAQGSGVATNFKIKLQQASKASVDQPIETQLKLLDRALESGKKLKRPFEAANQILEADPNVANLRTEVFRNLHSGPKSAFGQQQLEVGSSLDELPDPSSVPTGTIIEDDQGRRLVSNGRSWQKAG